MAAHIRRSSAGHRVSAEARPRDQPPERRSRRRIYAGRRQRPPAQPRSQRRSHSSFGAIPAVAALRNRLRILRTPTRPRRLSSSEPRIATESRWSSPPELLRSKLRPRLSNALPLRCERPSAADRQLQRHVIRLSTQEGQPSPERPMRSNLGSPSRRSRRTRIQGWCRGR